MEKKVQTKGNQTEEKVIPLLQIVAGGYVPARNRTVDLAVYRFHFADLRCVKSTLRENQRCAL